MGGNAHDLSMAREWDLCRLLSVALFCFVLTITKGHRKSVLQMEPVRIKGGEGEGGTRRQSMDRKG